IGVVVGFCGGRLIRYRPHLQHGNGHWRIRLLQAPQELSPICKTRNQLSGRTRRGRRDNRSPSPLAAAPTQCSSFRLLTLAGRYGMLSGSDCNNKRFREATGVKRRETIGIKRDKLKWLRIAGALVSTLHESELIIVWGRYQHQVADAVIEAGA